MALVLCLHTGQVLYDDPREEYLTNCGCLVLSQCQFAVLDNDENGDDMVTICKETGREISNDTTKPYEVVYCSCPVPCTTTT